MTATMNRNSGTYALANEEAEESVLGAILLSPLHGADEAMDALNPDDFYRPAHQAIFEAMRELYDANEPIDPISVASRLRATAMLERVGGVAFLTRLLDQVPSASNLSYYARLVTAAALRRRLIQASSDIRGFAEEAAIEVEDALDRSEQAVLAVADGKHCETPERVGAALGEALQAFEDAQDGEATGLLTGYRDVDRILGGLKSGNLLVLAARPSMGKSSWALGLAHRVAKAAGPVALFSLEMSRGELAQRLVCADAASELGEGGTRGTQRWGMVEAFRRSVAALCIAAIYRGQGKCNCDVDPRVSEAHSARGGGSGARYCRLHAADGGTGRESAAGDSVDIAGLEGTRT